jgi:hypothetical protein
MTLRSRLTFVWAKCKVRAKVTSPPKPLETHGHNFFVFQLNLCGHIPYVTSFLTRRWVCRLQLLLVLASAVILGSGSRGTHDHLLLSQVLDSPNLEGQVPLFISPRNSLARLYPQALGSLFVVYYDRRSTVEVFERASTGAKTK